MSESSSQNPRFGKYVLVAKLGTGGMAQVFKAQYANDPGVFVAIKRILPHFSEDQKLVNMLVNEARLSLLLNHPNIVPVLDFGVVNNNYFIAMEYIHGKDLKSIMIRCKSKKIELPIAMSIQITIEALKGLDYAHMKRDNFDQPLQIVHRDISPQNIMISYWGQTKVLDFGIAKAASKAEATQPGILKGKFSYMSPEQARGEDVDPRTDIFSVGLVVWELLTLENCFQAETDIKLLQKVRDAKIVNPSKINQKIPNELSRIVMKALQKKRNKRYQTAGEFAAALEEYRADRFGSVSEADISAFVRTLFNITPDEVAVSARAIKSKRPTESYSNAGRNLPETVAAPKDRSAISSGGSTPKEIPWIQRKKRLSLRPLGPVIGILLLVGFFWKVPPTEIWFHFDQISVSVASKFHQWRTGDQEKDQTLIEMNGLAVPEAKYDLQYSPNASSTLEELPFEQFDRVRGRILDLKYYPRPSNAKASKTQPGTWELEEFGYRVSYQINENTNTVIIQEIEKG